SIIIRRPFGSLRIPLPTIIHVRPIMGGELGVNYRRFGIGGLFGYIGHYRSSSMGRYQMWATNRDSLVVIETGKRKYIVSPDQPVHFTNDINSRRYQR
ncbi:MAG TPA: PH domain-containing protein, partial [Chitinophaga sp.]